MPRYVMKFTKSGYTKYISHLDLLRVFKRAFKVMGLDIKYSQGFNPHPKMGFAQPLSLGYSSLSEYLEFETLTEHDTEELTEGLRPNLPEDVEILELFLFNSEVRTLAAETVACGYDIYIPTDLDIIDIENISKKYLAQKSIKAMKRMKKTKAFEEVEIRDKIRSIDVKKEGNTAVLSCVLDSGSQSNLSPELIISSLLSILLSSSCALIGPSFDSAPNEL